MFPFPCTTSPPESWPFARDMAAKASNCVLEPLEDFWLVRTLYSLLLLFVFIAPAFRRFDWLSVVLRNLV